MFHVALPGETAGRRRPMPRTITISGDKWLVSQAVKVLEDNDGWYVRDVEDEIDRLVRAGLPLGAVEMAWSQDGERLKRLQDVAEKERQEDDE